MEDHSNRTRLAKLLRFYSSNSDKEMTSLAEYIERMKEKQDAIYFMAGTSRKEVTLKFNVFIPLTKLSIMCGTTYTICSCIPRASTIFGLKN